MKNEEIFLVENGELQSYTLCAIWSIIKLEKQNSIVFSFLNVIKSLHLGK